MRLSHSRAQTQVGECAGILEAITKDPCSSRTTDALSLTRQMIDIPRCRRGRTLADMIEERHLRGAGFGSVDTLESC